MEKVHLKVIFSFEKVIFNTHVMIFLRSCVWYFVVSRGHGISVLLCVNKNRTPTTPLRTASPAPLNNRTVCAIASFYGRIWCLRPPYTGLVVSLHFSAAKIQQCNSSISLATDLFSVYAWRIFHWNFWPPDFSMANLSTYFACLLESNFSPTLEIMSSCVNSNLRMDRTNVGMVIFFNKFVCLCFKALQLVRWGTLQW